MTYLLNHFSIVLGPDQQLPATVGLFDAISNVFTEDSATLAHHPQTYFWRKPNIFLAYSGGSLRRISEPKIDAIVIAKCDEAPIK